LVTLITGTRKGIGRFLAEHYLDNEHVVIGCSRTESDLKHDNYYHYIADVSDEKQVKDLVKSAYKKFGRIDNLINNAGIAMMNHIIFTPVSAVNNVFSTNYLGTFIFTREVSKVMMKNNYGRIVNFSTVAVPINLDGEAIYASSKAAIVELTKISAKELGSYGITVNAIGPTPIKTDLIKNIPEDKIDRLLGFQAIKRFGEFEDISNVIDFFINKNSSFITGQIIYLGGL
jgi:3-oxoacyl-[acyl-carrier protein] reductase